VNARPSFRIMPVRTANGLASAVKLFRAYASSLDIDLSYQDFEAEMEAMPGKYAPPAGELLLARYPNGTPVGCVGLRPIDPQGCCEMKRLYVSSEGRGFGLGERLVDAVVKEAKRIGYREMRLDTLPSGVARGTSISSLRAKLTNCSHHCLGRLAWEEMSRDGHDPSLIWAGREAVVALR
jgi:GNAT superfamily N-acetyltransferase